MTPEEFWATLHAMTEPQPVFYRLYYKEDGTPICYTMEDLPGKYIDVDQAAYTLADYSVRVVDEKLIKIVPKRTVQKLSPHTQGTACDPRDVCVIIREGHPHIKWSMSKHETD